MFLLSRSAVTRLQAAVVAVIVVVAVVAGVGYWYWQMMAAPAPPIPIGWVHDLTGPSAHLGEDGLNAIKIAIKEINEAGGVLGRQLKLCVEDDGGKPEVTVSAFTKLVVTDKIVVCVGALTSTCTMALLPVAEREKIPIVNTYSGSAKITASGYNYTFRIISHHPYVLEDAGKFIMDNIKPKTIGYLIANDETGKSYRDVLPPNMPGVEIVATEWYTRGAVDYYAQLAKIKTANPGMIFMHGEVMELSLQIKQAREIGLTQPIFTSLGLIPTELIKLAGTACELATGLCHWFPSAKEPKSIAFVDKYKKAYGKDPEWPAATNYDVAYVIADAIKRAGSTDPTAIRDALRTTNLAVLRTPIKFDKAGQAKMLMFIVQIQGQRPVVVFPAEFAEASYKRPT